MPQRLDRITDSVCKLKLTACKPCQSVSIHFGKHWPKKHQQKCPLAQKKCQVSMDFCRHERFCGSNHKNVSFPLFLFVEVPKVSPLRRRTKWPALTASPPCLRRISSHSRYVPVSSFSSSDVRLKRRAASSARPSPDIGKNVLQWHSIYNSNHAKLANTMQWPVNIC